jgi:hypothetical protein
MDMRVESLISSIPDYCDECKKKLDLIKDDFKKFHILIFNYQFEAEIYGRQFKVLCR